MKRPPGDAGMVGGAVIRFLVSGAIAARRLPIVLPPSQAAGLHAPESCNYAIRWSSTDRLLARQTTWMRQVSLVSPLAFALRWSVMHLECSGSASAVMRVAAHAHWRRIGVAP